MVRADVERGAPDLAQVFNEHAPFVWRTLRRLGLSPADADDATQEVFLVVHRKLRDFENRSSLRTWIYGICVRVAFAALRRARAPHAGLEPSPSQAPDEHVAMREARALLDRALSVLDDDKRAVFVLFEIEQLPMAEVAVALECPLQTAYSRLHAARARVTEAIEALRCAEGRGP